MRNLRTLRLDTCRDAEPATAACWDAASDEMVVASGPTAADPWVRLGRVVEEEDGSSLHWHEVAAWEAQPPRPDLDVDRIVGLQYFGEAATACVVMAGGDIVEVQEGRVEGDVRVEIVGSVDAGIAAACWSPDGEVLAVVTEVETEAEAETKTETKTETQTAETAGTCRKLLLMSRALEPVGEAVLTAADLAASKHVTVGWGRKETQFRGRGAAQAMRDPTLPQTVETGRRSAADDGTAVAVSWRGDGAFVAVNAVEHDAAEPTEGARRVIRVFSRAGVLDSASEPVDGLEAALSWRPSGNLVAGVQQTADGQRAVVFFERNGLRHGGFALDAAAVPHTPRLAWNVDATVLAAVYPTAVQLWTMGNYHWYLKQEVPTGGSPGASSSPAVFSWHPEKALRLLTAAAGTATIVRAEYVLAMARGSRTPPADHGAVAVVDGATLLLTPLRFATVPPPMSRFTLRLPRPVVDVAMAPGDAAVAAVHADGIDVWTWTAAQRTKAPAPAASVTFARPFRPLQIAFPAPAVVCVLGHDDAGLRVDAFAWSAAEAQLRPAASTGLTPGAALVDGPPGALYVQDAGGAMVRLALPTLTPDEASVPEALPAHVPWVEMVDTGDMTSSSASTSTSTSTIPIGLSRHGHLYAGQRLLAKNCTSFVTTPDHIVFTTTVHLLKLVHLADADLSVPLDDPETDERCRRIERGARLVTAVPSSLSVVLQMPRGNLETVFPRAVVVAGIRRLVDARDYGRAFACCRTQRVDMNILYDHRPAQFLGHVGLFLGQLPDVAAIDLFLSSLREEDVCQTMYKDTRTMATPATAPTTAATSKVNTVCDAVLASLLGAGPPTAARLQNVITAHVCKDPPALDDGLRVVAQLLASRDQDAHDRQDKDTAKDRADRAVEHICFLVDVHRLYDHALGLYDLGLAMAVAQQAQRDPREYVPFLQALHATTPAARRRFAIDDHLGRHDKALAHLQDLGPDAFDELLDYVDRHRLYHAALALYRYRSPSVRQPGSPLARITERYAAHLESQSHFRAAGLAHESLGPDPPRHFAAAARCYQSAGASCWRECLAVTETLAAAAADPTDTAAAQSTLAARAATLAEALLESRDYSAAATVQLDYLGAVEAAVTSLCRGYAFAEAMRVAVRRGRTDLLATAVDSGLGDAVASSTELLADCRAQLRAQVPRILELRATAAADPLRFYEGHVPDTDVPDDVSVAASSRLSTSGGSLFTRYSTQTGKTGQTGQTGKTGQSAVRARRKREEKKRARGRKGTVYELAYLVGSVRRLVARVEQARSEVAALVAALVRRDMLERARAVEALLAELVEACRAAIGDVWPAPAAGTADPDAEAPDDEAVDKEPAPVMTPLTRLALLG